MKYNVDSIIDSDKKVCLMVAEIIRDLTEFKPKVVQHGENYVVRVGTYPTKEKAERVCSILKKNQITAILYLAHE